MRSLMLLIVSIVTSLVVLDGQNVPDSLNIEIQAFMDAAVAQAQFVGGVAAVALPDREPVFSASGWANVETREAFTSKTLNRIASIAKPMTAVAVLQLHEQGLLQLDHPIQTYLPDFPNGDQFTIQQVLYHTSGVGHYQGKETQNKQEYTDLAAAVAVFQDRPLAHEPGSAFTYSSYGYTLLGRLIEVVAGMDYESYMQTHIWDPAGMTHTGVEKAAGVYGNKSALYVRTKSGKLKLSKPNNLSNRVPGGGLYSTVEDLVRFGRAVLDNTLLNEETTALMFTHSPAKQEGSPYAMGWYCYGSEGRETVVVGHSGEQTGVAAQLMIHREKDIVVAVVTNTARAWPDVIGIAVQLFPVAYRY